MVLVYGFHIDLVGYYVVGLGWVGLDYRLAIELPRDWICYVVICSNFSRIKVCVWWLGQVTGAIFGPGWTWDCPLQQGPGSGRVNGTVKISI